MTNLLQSAKEGRVAEVEKLLKNGANIEEEVLSPPTYCTPSFICVFLLSISSFFVLSFSISFLVTFSVFWLFFFFVCRVFVLSFIFMIIRNNFTFVDPYQLSFMIHRPSSTNYHSLSIIHHLSSIIHYLQISPINFIQHSSSIIHNSSSIIHRPSSIINHP